LLPEARVRAAVDVRARRPRYLGEQDLPWVDSLVEVYRAQAGARRAELDLALRGFLAEQPNAERVRRAITVMDRFVVTRVRASVDPRTIRARLFEPRAPGVSRAAALAQTAQALGLTVDDLERMMFADFARERRVEALPEEVGAPDVVSLANLALVQGIVARSAFVRMRARSGARDLIRHARLVGLMHVVTRDHDHQDGFVIDVSGPLSIFRSTRLYARALGSIVPRLAWCRGFALEAHLHVGGERTAVQVREGDPIRPSRRPAPFDSKLEARFAREFTREATDYELVREPAAIEIGAHMVFPDFAVVHRTDPTRHGLVEIVGFYTQDYLARKLAQMRNERLARLVLCIDESLQVSDSDLPRHAQVVRFKKRVSVVEVVQAIERLSERDATGHRASRG
jgi:predicted nuclease of restriction endonuclease-like RecB superfamily